MNETLESETKKGIIQNVRGAAFNLWEIGRLLHEAEGKGLVLKDFIEKHEGEFGFGYKRALAFKKWYSEGLANPHLDVRSLGVDKTLALIEPLKEDSGEFLIQNPPALLEKMRVDDVREAVHNYKREKLGLPKREKYEKFFLDAEDSFSDIVHQFEGIVQKYPEEFKKWDGKNRLMIYFGRLEVIRQWLVK